MTCLQPETETRDNIQHPIESNSNMKNGACTGDSNGALQPCPSVWKTNTALNWRSDYQQAALVLELPPLSAWPPAEWTMGKMDYTEGSAHSGIALNALECASAECRCPAPLAGIQADPLPPFIQQLTTCLSDTRDRPFLLLFIFTLVSLTQLRCIL